jgi:hypothetical protein
MRLNHHFTRQGDTDGDDQITEDRLVPKKDKGWTPNAGINTNLDTYLNNVKHRITQHNYQPKGKHNLTESERQALREISQDPTLILKPADKGGAIVVMTKEQYLQKAEDLLNNRHHYRRIYRDLNGEYTKQITEYINKKKQETKINPEVATYITPRQPRTPVFYILPKIHKKNIPGRPIVSAIDSPTDKISKFLDNILRPLVPRIPSYIKDTGHLLGILKDLHHIPSTAIIATMDVSALYTNIPHSEGVQASLKAILQADIKSEHCPPPEVISYLMRLTLERNCFEFNSKYYVQITGTAMGTAMAPSYANLFMHELETKLLQGSKYQPYRWYRYIDDILIIWVNTKEALDEFVTYANNYHPTIKFTMEQSTDEIPFLDLYIQLRDNRITTRTYHKPTDAHNYLHYSSNHPSHQKKGIPYSQFLRMVRNCTLRKDAEYSINLLFQKFLQRGYPRRLLQEQKTKALVLTQETILAPKDLTRSTQESLIYITTHNPSGPRTKDILLQFQPILRNHPHTNHMENFIVAYRRPRNLRDILVHSSMSPRLPSGTFKCKNCTICPHIREGPSFVDSSGKHQFRTQGHITCMTNYVIYLIQCKKCKTQYVGQTSKNIKTRLTQHLGDIKRKEKKKTVAVHFNIPGHCLRDVTIGAISLAPRITSERLLSEKSWMITLKTMQPWGLNVQNA